MADKSGFSTDHMTHNAQNTFWMALFRKNMLVLVVDLHQPKGRNIYSSFF